jgi:hypothetical protein
MQNCCGIEKMTQAAMTPNADKIRKWLEAVIDDPASRRRVLIRGSLELKDRYIVYPKEGPWNRYPGAKPRTDGKAIWYQRKFGPRYMRKDGTTGGRNTSQNLQVSWNYEIGADDYSSSVFTPVTYAPYLFDPEKRVGWAAAHGWQDVNEIAENYAPRFVQIVEDEIDNQIAKPIE